MKIAVIGLSCAGKTTLTHELAVKYPDHQIFHTDEYRPVDFEMAIEPLMNDILACKNPNIICEGVHTFRLLRKGAELRKLFFDVVIEVKTDPLTQMKRYLTNREASKWDYIPGFNKSLMKIYRDYQSIVASIDRKPVYLEYNT